MEKTNKGLKKEKFVCFSATWQKFIPTHTNTQIAYMHKDDKKKVGTI